MINAIIECRDKRRILVFNPYLFPNESEMFRVLEILMRNLVTISNNYFDALTPSDVGKTTRKQMTPHELTKHKMCFLIREFGEVAPARLKGDKSGESTLIKKALLKFVRISRHYNIDGIIDYQNASDVDSSIRNQINLWLIKTWTPELAGDSFDYLFKTVNDRRKAILEEYEYDDDGFGEADDKFPPIERLTSKYFYFVKRGQLPLLSKVPELPIMHKEPSDKWWNITGIPIQWDRELIQKSSATPSSFGKSSKTNDKITYFTIKEIKTNGNRKEVGWKKIIEKMVEKQESGEITTHFGFKTVKPNTVQRWFSRMKNMFETVDNET